MVQVFRYAGFGKETTFGTPVTPTFYIAPQSITMGPPKNAETVVPSGMGRMPRKKKPGYYVPSGGITYQPDVVSLGYLLNWTISGGYQFTSGSPNTHEIYATNNNDPTFFTLVTGKDVIEQQFNSTVINNFKLSVSDSLASCGIDMFAQMDVPSTIKTENDISSTLVSGSVFGFQDSTCTFNDADKSAYMKSFDIAITNNINAATGRTIGSRFPRRWKSNGLDISWNATVVYEDTDMFELYWGSQDGADVNGSSMVNFKPKFTIGDDYVEFNLPNNGITSVDTPSYGSDEIVQTISGIAYLENDVALADASTVDTSILVTVKNTNGTMA